MSLDLPAFGFGTHCLKGEAATQAVLYALQCGYRLIDTAAGYKNKEAIGHAIASSGVPRDQLFVTTKLDPKDQQGKESVFAAFEKSRAALRLAFVDCYMMHWPATAGMRPDDPSQTQLRQECWLAMESLQQRGLVRHIAVSNFQPVHFEALTGPKPWLNQLELHPLCRQQETVDYCRANGIRLQAYSPLGRGSLAVGSCISEATRRHHCLHGRSGSELALWVGFSRGYDSYIPRSANFDHIAANLTSFHYWSVMFSALKLDADHPNAHSWEGGGIGVGEPHNLIEFRRAIRDLDGMFEDQRRSVGGDTHYCWHSTTVPR